MTTNQDSAKKSTYRAPELRTYGDIAALTKAGSGSTAEQTSGQGATTKHT